MAGCECCAGCSLRFSSCVGVPNGARVPRAGCYTCCTRVYSVAGPIAPLGYRVGCFLVRVDVSIPAPRVSVITSCRDADTTLRATVASLLWQTEHNWELI